jgi:hypothetical protein
MRLVRIENIKGEIVTVNPDHVVLIRPPIAGADPPGAQNVIVTTSVTLSVHTSLDELQRQLEGDEDRRQ